MSTELRDLDAMILAAQERVSKARAWSEEAHVQSKEALLTANIRQRTLTKECDRLNSLVAAREKFSTTD